MVTQDDIGQAVVVKAVDEFYSFIDGWEFILQGFDEQGRAILPKDSEEFPDITRQFLVPPDQVHRASF